MREKQGGAKALDDARHARFLVAAQRVRLRGGCGHGLRVGARDEGRARRAVGRGDELGGRDLVLGRHLAICRLAASVRRAGVQGHRAVLTSVVERGVNVRPVGVRRKLDVARLVERAPAWRSLESAQPVHGAIRGGQPPRHSARGVGAVRVQLAIGRPLGLAGRPAAVGGGRREVERLVGGVVLDPEGGAQVVELFLPHERAIGRGELGDEAVANLLRGVGRQGAPGWSTRLRIGYFGRGSCLGPTAYTIGR